MNRRLLILTICCSSWALAQEPGNVEGTFQFTTPQTPQALQEAVTILRTVMDLPKVSIDHAHGTLTFNGPATQTAAAEWTLGELDRPGGEAAVHAYTLTTGEVVRVNILPNVATSQAMQELLTVLRTVADVQRIFSFTARRAIVIRAQPAEMAFAEWIVDQLNHPAGQRLDPAPRVYGEITPNNMVARVNALPNVTTPMGMQQVLSVLRTVGDVMKIFNYSPLQSLILRARQPDMDRAEWLIQQLNEPTPGTHVFNAATGDDVTRVFFLPNATPAGLQSATTALRTETGVRKVFCTSDTLTARGTADQVAAAAQLIAQRSGF